MPKASPLQVGTEFSIVRPAGTVVIPGRPARPQRFTDATFRGQIGGRFALRSGERIIGVVSLLGADVADDGSAVSLVYKVEHLVEEKAA